jgi:hypothetical protein
MTTSTRNKPVDPTLEGLVARRIAREKKTAAWPKARSMATGDLLGIASDAKTVKGEVLGIRTAIQYLAPADVSGRNVCQFASDGCRAACLNTAGRGKFDMVQNARIRRTNRFFDDRGAYMARLVFEVARHVTEAIRDGMIPAVRLNGTSDLPWERLKCERDGITYPSIMAAFAAENVQFYDYTKVPVSKRNPASNYHLTFSLSEDNDADAYDALAAGYNVAVVFDIKSRGGELPATFMGREVINADDSDVRFYDPEGVIVGLKAKGDAKSDTSGFVR